MYCCLRRRFNFCRHEVQSSNTSEGGTDGVFEKCIVVKVDNIEQAKCAVAVVMSYKIGMSQRAPWCIITSTD
ncbi:hypothetical protein AB4K20DRAFT_1906264 [Rhizopus microsporus]